MTTAARLAGNTAPDSHVCTHAKKLEARQSSKHLSKLRNFQSNFAKLQPLRATRIQYTWAAWLLQVSMVSAPQAVSYSGVIAHESMPRQRDRTNNASARPNGG